MFALFFIKLKFQQRMSFSKIINRPTVLLFILAACFSFHKLDAQNLPKAVTADISKYLTSVARQEVAGKAIAIDSVIIAKKTINLYAGVELSYIPFRKKNVNEIYAQVKKRLPKEYKNYSVAIYSDKYKIEEYIPSSLNDRFTNRLSKPLITNTSRPFDADKGLQGHHLALWQSHGWYYEQKLGRWQWQRARIFQTVEDLYTQSYVLPYLVPMLENAGANVLLPRERDTQLREIIIDNDHNRSQSTYKEKKGKEKWVEGETPGFANLKGTYQDGENPFKTGTFRQTTTISKGKESFCEWIPNIPETGKYGVYISYQTLENSTDDALYTVYHLGGETEFKINQTMGGGTWIFLGFFSFEEGSNDNCKVVLSNKSQKSGRVLTADAVKIGGGMGNIARSPLPKETNKINYQPTTSNYPRYTEGARYWLQWAGVPDSVYSRTAGENDYSDDFQSRGFWVNYIAGGSSVLPEKDGLNIPIDLAMAFHSDAGTTPNDSIIGTLGICMTHINDEKFENGKPRLASRHLTDMITDEIITDIRLNYEPNWTRRPIWNRSYSEARVPEVPTMLLELLSHQNFADMRYGLDPQFQFTVSRSVYKGILKFVAHQYGYDYVVQPLPVKSFSLDFVTDTQVRLNWIPTLDTTEPTATPTKYVVYMRIDNGDFDNGEIVPYSNAQIEIQKDKIYSFKVAAVNDGGESFPSEILSVCRKSNDKGTILVVNGFDRISAPASFTMQDSIAGFLDGIDHGVPDKTQYNYTGSQYEFRRDMPYMGNDTPGFGGSNADFETTVVAGNTFDYPYLHGKAIAKAGYSFVSAGRDAVVNEQVKLNNYPVVDLILGKQKQTYIGRGYFTPDFKTFPAELQSKITNYCKQGGNILVSGAFVGSDLWYNGNPLREDIDFASNILKYKWQAGRASARGNVNSVASPFSIYKGELEFYNSPNTDSYGVESPDAIEPSGDNSYTIFRYPENNLSAGIASRTNYKTCVLGFPFEVIEEENQRNDLMKGILSFMFRKD